MSDQDDLFVEQIEIGPMQNFVYVIGSRTTREAAIVDPAWDIDGLLDYIEEQDLKPVAALITHYHPDHCGGGMRGHHIPGVSELIGKRDLLAAEASLPVRRIAAPRELVDVHQVGQHHVLDGRRAHPSGSRV